MLIGEITQAVSKGTLDATGWGTKAEWQRDLTIMHETYVRVTTEQMVRDCREEFETFGYRAVLERPGAILGLVSHLMLAKSPSQPHLQSHVSVSPQISQFIQFCQAPTALRNSVLSSSSPSFVSAPGSKSQSFTGSSFASPLTLAC